MGVAHACWLHQGGEGGVGRRVSEPCEKRTLAGLTKVKKEGYGGGCAKRARSARLPTPPKVEKEEKGRGELACACLLDR